MNENKNNKTYKLYGMQILTLLQALESLVSWLFEPAQEIMVLIAQANSEGSGESAHPRSLARAFAVRTQSMEVDKGSGQKSDV